MKILHTTEEKKVLVYKVFSRSFSEIQLSRLSPPSPTCKQTVPQLNRHHVLGTDTKYSLLKSQGSVVKEVNWTVTSDQFQLETVVFCKNLSQNLPQDIFLQSTYHKAELPDLSMVSNEKYALSEKGIVQDPAASAQNCPLKKFLSLFIDYRWYLRGWNYILAVAESWVKASLQLHFDNCFS